MNAASLLQKQGWRGQGFSLDTSDRGLAKPLLVNHKSNTSGLGNKPHDFTNQWWLKAWDSDSPASQLLPSAPALDSRSKLYSSFTKSEELVGTILSQSDINSKAAQSDSLLQQKVTTSIKTPGVSRDHLPSIDMEQAEDNRKRKSGNKRRSSDETGSQDLYNKKQKTNGEASEHSRSGFEQNESFVSLVDSSQGSDTRKTNSAKEGKPRKLKPKEVRAQRKAERTQKIRENTHRNKVANEEKRIAEERERAAKIASGEIQPEEPKPVHPDSIAAMRARGERVELPSPPPPPKDSRVWLTEESAAPKHPPSKREKFALGRKPHLNQPEQPNPPGQGKKKSYKAEKYEREKRKREMKREYKFWQQVKAHPEDYRPDGSRITLKDRGMPLEELRAKREAEKAEKQRQAAEKQAKRSLKEQMKVERRVARKMRRAEKKMANHQEMQKHISAKIQRQKREKDEAAAKELGQTYEEYVAERDANLARQRAERDAERAKSDGISVEELHQRRAEAAKRKEMIKEARKLGISPEEYMNQAAEPNDSELGSGGEGEQGLKYGTWDTFGRSPLDKLWAKHEKEKITSVGEHGGVDDTNKNETTTVNGKTTRLESSKDDSSSISDSTSSPESDSESEKKNDENNSRSVNSKKHVDDGKQDETQNQSKTTTAFNAAADFVSIKDSEKPLDGVFMVDTQGTTPKQERMRVRDLSKEERQARLENMKKRREEKAISEGKVKLSKQARRTRRQARKEELIQKMTKDILRQKREDIKNERVVSGGDIARPPEDELKRLGVVERHGYAPPPTSGKMAMKQARREARRVMRGLKKGRISEHEVPEGWAELYGESHNKKRKMRGNGGREPKRWREGQFKA